MASKVPSWVWSLEFGRKANILGVSRAGVQHNHHVAGRLLEGDSEY